MQSKVTKVKREYAPWLVKLQHYSNLSIFTMVAFGTSPYDAKRKINRCLSSCGVLDIYHIISVMRIDNPNFVAVTPFVYPSTYQDLPYED